MHVSRSSRSSSLPRRAVRLALGLALLLAPVRVLTPAAARAAPASPWSSQGGRALYRVSPLPHQDLRSLLSLSLDIAGVGPKGSLDLILTAEELEQVRALGYAPVPLDLTPRGLYAAPESPLMKPDLGAYHTYDEAAAEMASYAALYPSIAALDTIGLSVEGRPVLAMKISDNVAVEEGEPEVLVVGCHHARELMSVEIPLYLMRRLLDGYGLDPVLTALVNERQIWIVPVLNPDGLVYVQDNSGGQSDTWWRKNRRDNGDGTFGVDLNRNYAFEWGYDDVGSSPTTGSDVYRGTGPFSEPETAALRDLMTTHAFRITASFHSYGQLFLWPWGYQPADTPDQTLFQAFGDSVSVQNGYLAGNPASGAIYLTNGEMNDWVYGETSQKPRALGFAFEVNTADQGGFAPPENLIGPTCELNWGPLLTLLRYGDVPRRILPPVRPSQPEMAEVDGHPGIDWSYPAPDPDNLPVRHEVKRVDSLSVVTDDAEEGVADWDSTDFSWSTARAADGTHSYYSGAGDSRTSVLTAHGPIDVASVEDSLTVMAYWDLESLADFWYAEASGDGGTTWATLAGDRTTDSNPNGTNAGHGVTGTSGGFLRCAFSLHAYAGGEALIRFCCVTNASVHGEGLYLDDIAPVAREGGATVLDTGSPDTSYALDPPPGAPTWFQVRAVDGEGQRSRFSDRLRYEPTTTAAAAAPISGAPRVEAAGAQPLGPGGTLRLFLPPGAGRFRLDAFDVHGRRVRRLAEGFLDGRGAYHSVRWDGTDDRGVPVGSGVYLLRLTTPRAAATAKLTLLR